MRSGLILALALTVLAGCEQVNSGAAGKNALTEGATAEVGATEGATTGAGAPVIDAGAMRVRAKAMEVLRRQLADPDPNLQLAAMEAAVATGDATARQLALQVGFASADQGLRAAALSHYFAGNPTITINISPVKEYDAAVTAIEEARAKGQNRELSGGWQEYHRNVQAMSQLSIIVKSFDRATGQFSFNVRDGYFQRRIDEERFPTGSVAGETVNLTASVVSSEGEGTLNVTLSVAEGGVLRGHASMLNSSYAQFSRSPAEVRIF